MARAVEGSTSEGDAEAGIGPPVGSSAAADARGADLKGPDFFIVGHQKCGTTALYRMLQEHPQIYMPAEKEPRFLIPELRARPRNGRTPKRPTTMEGYLRLFAPAEPGQISGEASPQYLRYPHVPAAIAELRPDAKIIALLREPADFLRSFHGQMLHNRIETEKSFQKAMELEPARRRGERFPRGCNRKSWLLYSDHIRYAEQLGWYHERFPREQVLVLLYEDYRRDNEAVVREVLRFLEVDDSLPIEQVDTRPLKDVRFQPLHQLTGAMQEARRNPSGVSRAVRAIDAVVPTVARERFGEQWRRFIYQPRAKPDESFMRELRMRFRPEVQAAGEYIGRDLLGIWGYDKLD
jgi:hypothetical protein